ncbi:uncharacterized protein [Misgurnus anguillicaudatus]|uniref:uncharacterized protein n=1 Tax=Misgurnus anguillicaudatus TaxID=75329 RepID=UPI003CCF0666
MTVRMPINTNPKSKWPSLRHILGNLCLSPAGSIPQDVKSTMLYLLTALGILQIIVGMLNIVTGILFANWGIHDYMMMFYGPYWLGAVFLISGIMTLLVGCCRSIVLDILSLILNQVSAFVALMGVALYSWDLVSASYYSANDYSATLIQEQRNGDDAFVYFKDSNMMFRRTLDVMMIALAVLQLCLNVYFIVILVRVFVEKNSAEDPQLHKLLPEDTTGNLA